MSSVLAFGRYRRSGRAASFGTAWARLADGVAADQDRLVLWLAPLLGIGILAYFALRHEPAIWLGLVPTLFLSASLPLLRWSRPAHALAVAALALTVGFLAAQIAARERPPMPTLPRKAVIVTGRIAAIDLMPDARRRLTVGHVTLTMAAPAAAAAVEAATFDRALRIRLRPDDTGAFHVGDLVRIRALLREPSAPDYPGGRDPQRDAFFGDVAGSGRALSSLAVLSPSADDGVASWLRARREAIAGRITAILPGSRGAIAATLLTGLSTSISQVDRDAFAASGLAHLLAVAGLHLGVVMLFSLLVVRSALALWEWGALRLPCRELAVIASLLFGTVYMLLTGLHLPGVRALTMATVAALGMVIGRRAISLRGLAFAASAILLVSPATLLDVGFQMSFAAVLALLAGYEAARPLTKRLYGPGWRPALARHVFQLFFTSLLAGAASLPFAAFHFGRVQFYFVLANLIAVPLTAFWVLPVGLLALFAMPLGLEAPLLRAMGHGIDLILVLARAVSALPAASLPVPLPPVWGLLSVSAGLLWLCLWRLRWRWLALLPLALGCVSPWVSQPPDVLVSEDASVIGFREAGALWLERGQRNDPLTVADWQKALALVATPHGLPDAGSPAPDLFCNPAACVLERGGDALMLVRVQPGSRRDSRSEDDDGPAGNGLGSDDCRDVVALVSAAPSRGFCPGVARVDRFTVWREGPQAIWMRQPGVTIWSAERDRGHRPWVPPGPGRSHSNLPLARAE